MKKLSELIFVILLAFFLPGQVTNGCTNFIVTKGASVKGSTMITYAADSHQLYGELYYWPQKTTLPAVCLTLLSGTHANIWVKLPGCTYIFCGRKHE